jgi:hypothetical protein
MMQAVACFAGSLGAYSTFASLDFIGRAFFGIPLALLLLALPVAGVGLLAGRKGAIAATIVELGLLVVAAMLGYGSSGMD